MLALYLNDKLELRDLPRPEPQPGEVLIRVRLAGVCRTDLEVLQGYHGFRGVPGHEFVGQVVAPEDSSWLNRRVVGEINLACGQCLRCRQGLAHHCQQRQVLGMKGRNGTFAQYLTLPAANLHSVPEEVADDAAVFTEPLAAALQVLETAAFSPDSRVLVVGDGSLGLQISWILALHGAEVHLVGRYPEHLELAGAYGVSTYLEPEMTQKDFDVVVEASGSPSGLELALARVRPRGAVVLKSTYSGGYPLNTADLVVPEVRLLGSRCGPFPAALRLLQKDWIDPRPLIYRRYPLAQGLEALAYAQEKGVLKVLLECGE
ncbi:MAG: alcohol dehydrogenase [Deltaproteobacteria bacterium]|nr:alcohol dehydrogenase [Deltaproteobacteria bacterium]